MMVTTSRTAASATATVRGMIASSPTNPQPIDAHGCASISARIRSERSVDAITMSQPTSSQNRSLNSLVRNCIPLPISPRLRKSKNALGRPPTVTFEPSTVALFDLCTWPPRLTTSPRTIAPSSTKTSPPIATTSSSTMPRTVTLPPIAMT